jgi:hypothetical protein
MAKSPSRFNLSGGDSLNSLGSHGGEVADPMIEAVWATDLGLYSWPMHWIFERSLHFVARLNLTSAQEHGS